MKKRQLFLWILVLTVLVAGLSSSSLSDSYQTPVYGNVKGEIYPGSPNDSPILMPLNHAYVALDQATQLETNNLGDYNGGINGIIPNLVFKLEGPYAKVDDWVTGTPYTASVDFLSSPCNYSWTGAANRNAINVFYHINLVHDWYQNHIGYSWINPWDNSTQFKAQVNYPEGDAWAGNPMLYGIPGDFAKYGVTVYHESSHNVYAKLLWNSPGTGGDGYSEDMGLNEGFADYFAYSCRNDYLYGPGVNGDFVMNNYYQYMGKIGYNTECHQGGRTIGGAVWDLRNILVSEMGGVSGSEYTDRMAFKAYQLLAAKTRPYYYSDPRENNFLKCLYLADDDNANLADGIPHFTEIQRALIGHNLTQAVIKKDESFDVSTNSVGSITRGDFYYSPGVLNGVLNATFPTQKGIKDLGDIGNFRLESTALDKPDRVYNRNGVVVVPGHTYVSLAHEGEEGNYIVFRVTYVSPDRSQINILYYYCNKRITLKNQDGYDFSQQIRLPNMGGDFYLYQNQFWASNAGQSGVINLGNIGSITLDQVIIPATGYNSSGVSAVIGNTYVAKAGQGENDWYIVFRVVGILGTNVTIDYLYRKRNQVTIYNEDSFDFSKQTRHLMINGDFYLKGLTFWANNYWQRGVISLGKTGATPLDQITIPTTGYIQTGVPAVLGNTYVSLAQQGEEGHYIVFQVTDIKGTCVQINYLYR